MAEPHYSESEIHAIFERAAVRQEAAERAEKASRAGLSLADLQRIGVEAGIDPAHIAAAARDLARPAHEPAPTSFLGMPTELRASRFIPMSVTGEAWEQVVPELRRIFKQDGLSGELGRVREWAMRPSRSSSDRPARVTLTPEGDGTRVEFEQTLKSSAWGLTAGSATYLVVASIIGTLALMGNFSGEMVWLSVLFVAMAVVFFGAAWGGMRLYGRSQEARFEHALDRIELIARNTAAPVSEDVDVTPPLPQQHQQEAPRLDLDALPDVPVTDPSRAPGERTRS